MVDPSLVVSMLSDGRCPAADLRTFLFEEGLVDSETEYRSLLREITIAFAREQVSVSAPDDSEALHAIRALDDVNEILNTLSERLSDWYSCYEWDREGGVERAEESEGEGAVSGSDGLAGVVMGRGDLPPVMRNFARNLTELHESRTMLIDHIGGEMTRIAPNLTNLAGALVAARLMGLAGGLRKLCMMPASRIQILGANRAMFRHLRGASAPKHGIIFQHPCIHRAPRRLRGRIARAFASKLAIAARIDYYGGGVRGELASELEARIAEIGRRDTR